MRDNLRGKNLSVPDSQQDWWKSSQPARCTSVQPATGLTVKFPSRRPGSLVLGQSGGGGGGAGRKWVWPKGVRGERFLTNNISSTYSTNQIPSDTLNCLFPGGTCLRGKYCFFHSSQPAKFCLKNAQFKEQIHWVPLYLLCLFPVFSHISWSPNQFSFFGCSTTVCNVLYATT